MRRTVLFVLLCGLGVSCLPAFSETVGLFDWCFNINGNWNSPQGACNGGGSVFGAGTTFDTTLEPEVNGLGSASFTLGVGQYGLAYMDYDLDFQTFGSFQDFGATAGTAPANVTWEMNDPNTSGIFSDFSSNALSDTNAVSAGSGPPNPCCDVAWALGFTNSTGVPGTITFTVSRSAPTSGFYLVQTNFDVGDSIYLSEKFTPVPDPPTLAEMLIGFAATLWMACLAKLRRPGLRGHLSIRT